MDHAKLNRQLTVGILIGLVFGLLIAFDVVPPKLIGIDFVKIASLVGDVFMLALKAIAVPLVFISVLCGVLSLGNILAFERMGSYTLAYYLGTTLISTSLGLILVNVIQPGVGLEIAQGEDFTKLDSMKDMTVLGMLETQIRTFIINPFGTL